MAVWDLNSNLDVFSMQTFLRGLNLCQVSDTGSSEPLVMCRDVEDAGETQGSVEHLTNL